MRLLCVGDNIHNGKVKQIIGGSLTDEFDRAEENYVSELDAKYYAKFYQKDHLKGGHIILLNHEDSSYYKETKRQAVQALNSYRGGLQIGGGIRADNACYYLEDGASHVIVTSYVFKNGRIDINNLERIKSAVGKEHLVIDLSCRQKNNEYYIVTDRWQKFTDVTVSEETLDFFKDYCDEFLIHAVDVEGQASGIEIKLAKMLGAWGKIPITYAGGIGSFHDLELLKSLGENKLDVTIG
ncbi:phosphoribosylformimino-5-aminoimidazole carboxamide ribotide isomerase, partial [Lachnotalea glycerini]